MGAGSSSTLHLVQSDYSGNALRSSDYAKSWLGINFPTELLTLYPDEHSASQVIRGVSEVTFESTTSFIIQ